MNHTLIVAISLLTLAGCADSYDKSVMPAAAAGLQQETVACKTRWTAKEFKTYSEWQACQLAAERGFARAINLTKMQAFEVYAADMQVLAADRDAKRVTDHQVRSRAEYILWKFLADCDCKPGWKPNPNYSHWLMIPFTTPQPPVMPNTP
jgi:hypothetical protein